MQNSPCFLTAPLEGVALNWSAGGTCGFDASGNIVLTAATGQAIEFNSPIQGPGLTNNDGSILWQNASGAIIEADPGQFTFDVDGTLGFFGVPLILYIGDPVNQANACGIAFWDNADDEWMCLYINSNTYNFGGMGGAPGDHSANLHCGNMTADSSVSADLLELSAAQTTVGGSIGGTLTSSMPESGNCRKSVLLTLAALHGTATYNFPNAFGSLPGIFACSTVSPTVVTALTTTSVTLTCAAATTGVILLENF